MLNFFKYSKKIGAQFINNLFKHDLFTYAAALSFYTALSLSPILMLIIAAAGVIGLKAEHLFIDQAQHLLGTQASKAIEIIIEESHKRQRIENFTGILGFIALLFSASAVFSQLQSSLNSIWGFESISNTKGLFAYVRNRIFSIEMLMVFGFLSIVSLTISTVISLAFPTSAGLWKVLNESVALVVFTCMFAFIFKSFSYVKFSWLNVFYGGLFTSILFALGKVLIGVYLGKSSVGSAYGASGALIIFLVWVYYSSLIVFIGAVFTHTLFSSRGEV